MKKVLLICLLATISFSSFAKKKNYKFTMHLHDVNPVLAKYEDDLEHNFIRDSVKYYHFGAEKYDNIFIQSAIIYASVKQLSGSFDIIESGDFDLEYGAEVIGLGATLPTLLDRLDFLQHEITTLDPTKDLISLKYLKNIPTAGKGLALSGKQLAYTAKELPHLLSKLPQLKNIIVQLKEESVNGVTEELKE